MISRASRENGLRRARVRNFCRETGARVGAGGRGRTGVRARRRCTSAPIVIGRRRLSRVNASFAFDCVRASVTLSPPREPRREINGFASDERANANSNAHCSLVDFFISLRGIATILTGCWRVRASRRRRVVIIFGNGFRRSADRRARRVSSRKTH